MNVRRTLLLGIAALGVAALLRSEAMAFAAIVVVLLAALAWYAGRHILDRVDYSAQTGISPPYSYPLKAGRSYEVDLQNQSPDSLRPILNATISFP